MLLEISFCKGLPGRVAAQISRCARLRASSRCARLRRRGACAGRRGEDPRLLRARQLVGLYPGPGSQTQSLSYMHTIRTTPFSHRRQLRQHTWRPRTNPCQPFEFTGSRGFPVNTHSHTRTQGHISSHEETADTPGKAKGRERGRGRGRGRRQRRSSDRWQRSLLRLSRSAVCAGCASGEGASVAARGHAAAAASRRRIRAR